MKNRVVITGMGVVAPNGIGLDEYWKALISGKSGIKKITFFDTTEHIVNIAGEIQNLSFENYIDPKEVRRSDRFVCLALIAADMALKDSGLNLEKTDLIRFGVIVGSGIGGIFTMEQQVTTFVQKGPKRISPFFIPMYIINMASGMISMRWALKGPNSAVVTACAAGTNAIGDAFKIIQRGDADIMIAGGTEAAITSAGMAGFANMKALSTRNDEPEKASRPFDKKRDGFVMGEGAGILVLESLEHATKRNARIYAEIAGYGMSADAYHITHPAPEGEGAVRSMRLAIKDAGLTPQHIDYINAHGTSTDLNDKFETKAIKTVFAEHAYQIAISSTKSMTGHLLGAAGGIECIATVMTIYSDTIHPTINYEFPDPDCDLDYVPNQSRKKVIRAALSNSFGFGGHNATLLLQKIQNNSKL